MVQFTRKSLNDFIIEHIKSLHLKIASIQRQFTAMDELILSTYHRQIKSANRFPLSIEKSPLHHRSWIAFLCFEI